MRIVHLSASGQLGGAETSLTELLKAVRSARPDFELHLVLGGDGPLRHASEALGVRTSIVAFPGELNKTGDSDLKGPWDALRRTGTAILSAGAYRKQLRRILKQLQPNVIHATGLKMQLLAAWCRPRGTPLIWHIHDYIGRRSIARRLMRIHARFCAHAITNSRSVEADFRETCPGVPVQTIFNAIDLTRFCPEGPSEDLDSLAGLSPASIGTVRFGLVGTYAVWKGHTVFLKAIAKARLAAPMIRGYVIGGPIYATSGSQHSEEILKTVADRLGLTDHIGFIGFQDPAPLMRSLDCVVHASTAPEPFGMVIVEGMACGRALVVSGAGGALEIVNPGRNALVHAPGDADGLAAQLVLLAGDPALRARLGMAGRETAEALCKPSRLGSAIAAVYLEVGEGMGCASST